MTGVNGGDGVLLEGVKCIRCLQAKFLGKLSAWCIRIDDTKIGHASLLVVVNI